MTQLLDYRTLYESTLLPTTWHECDIFDLSYHRFYYGSKNKITINNHHLTPRKIAQINLIIRMIIIITIVLYRLMHGIATFVTLRMEKQTQNVMIVVQYVLIMQQLTQCLIW